MTNEDIINLFIAHAFGKDSTVKEVLAAPNGYPVYSRFPIVERTDGRMFGFGIKDYAEPNNYKEDEDYTRHNQWLNGASDEELTKFVKTFKYDFVDHDIERNKLYFSCSEVGKYQTNYLNRDIINRTIGTKLVYRALISNYYTVADAELMRDDRILKVTYDNGDVEYFTDNKPEEYLGKFNADEVNELRRKGVTIDEIHAESYNF